MSLYTIYKHTNKLNGKCYVGQTVHTPEKRWQGHLHGAAHGSNMVFHRALRKYGPDVWDHEVLEEVLTKADANTCEIKWIALLNSTHPRIGYNRTSGGDGGCMSDGALRRMGDKLRGVPKSPEHRERIRETQEHYWSDNPDDQRRQQLAERNKTDAARQASKNAQDRRWAKWRAEHPEQPKQLLSQEERSRRCSERMTGKKRGPYKNRGTKRGPRQTSVTCPTCKRTLKFISKRHACI